MKELANLSLSVLSAGDTGLEITSPNSLTVIFSLTNARPASFARLIFDIIAATLKLTGLVKSPFS